MPGLFVKCHKCGEPFPSGIAHDESESGKIILLGIHMKCPRCGDVSRYDTHEFFFPPMPNSAEPPPGESDTAVLSDAPSPSETRQAPGTSDAGQRSPSGPP